MGAMQSLGAAWFLLRIDTLPDSRAQCGRMEIYMKKDFSTMTTLEKQKAVYTRNFIALLSDAVFFSIGYTLFSTDNVLPVYISNLSDKPIYIALMTALFFGVQYSATVFSCMLGVNAKSPKWISIGVCFLQRVGFALILVSTFFIDTSVTLALILFFVSLVMYATSSGMSSPLFTQMVTFTIYKDVGSFFGIYNLFSCLSGVLATSVFTYCISNFLFPLNFRIVFLIGTVMAVVSTVTLSIFLKEVTDNRVREHIRFKDVFTIGVDIIKTNKDYRWFAISRAIAGAADFTVPYYILYAATLPDAPKSFVGSMATIYLLAKMFGSAIFGKLADKFGTTTILRGGCLCGIVAATLAIFTKDYRMAYVFYVILAFGVQGIYMTNQISSVEFSKGVRTPFYSAIVGVFCAPVAIITSFSGAAIASIFSYRSIFFIAICIYAASFISSILLTRKKA